MDGPVVYLHIGEPKCGTTFLQGVLWGNRGELARQGVSLPGLTGQDHYRAAQDLRGVEQPHDDPSGSWLGEWDILTQQALRAEQSAVIAHELLAGATAEQASRAVRSLEPAEVHLVLTVRDVATLLPAEWQETVKHRSGLTWESWLGIVTRAALPIARRPRWFWAAHDTLATLGRWSQLVPAERVHVITVPPPGTAPTSLWERFASVIEVEPSGFDTTGIRANGSLGVLEVELLRRLNQVLPKQIPDWFYLRDVKEVLAHDVLAARPRSARLALPPQHLEWTAEQSELVISGLRSSGYDIVGDLAELRPPAGVPDGGAAEVTDARLLEAALDALAGVLDKQYRGTLAPPAFRSTTTLVPSPRMKKMARDLSARYRVVARLRVLTWRLTERGRAGLGKYRRTRLDRHGLAKRARI